MTKSIPLNDLTNGQIIKVVFGNGDVLKGCFFGKRYIIHRGHRTEDTRGNFMITLEPVTNGPKVEDINTYKTKHKTSIKTVSGTRFPKEVSRYLKTYCRALTKEQEASDIKLKATKNQQKENAKLVALHEKSKDINYQVHPDELNVNERVQSVFADYRTQLKHRIDDRRLNQVDKPVIHGTETVHRVSFFVGFKALLDVADDDLGVTPDFEYDGSYSPDIDRSVNITKVACKLLRVSYDDTKQFIRSLNALSGINIELEELFVPHYGEYANDGSIGFQPVLQLDRHVKASDLTKAKQLLVDYILKAIPAERYPRGTGLPRFIR